MKQFLDQLHQQSCIEHIDRRCAPWLVDRRRRRGVVQQFNAFAEAAGVNAAPKMIAFFAERGNSSSTFPARAVRFGCRAARWRNRQKAARARQYNLALSPENWPRRCRGRSASPGPPSDDDRVARRDMRR
ncbi:MAG: hypothetical protein U1F20_08935 [Lysobacterales bacterium]